MSVTINESGILSEEAALHFEGLRNAGIHDGTTSTGDAFWWAPRDGHKYPVRGERMNDGTWEYCYVPYVGY